ncbi:MAG: ABC transporter permease [Chthonomonadaceae bacterium]|nr:ABC transporter permease [Chthonomonadaceae bacterium]
MFHKTKFLRSLVVRLFFGLLSLLFIAFVTFVADELAPGDAALAKVGEKASPQALANARHEMGLDRPWPVRFVEFVGNAARGDFGHSWFGTQEKVSTIVARALPYTVKISVLAILLASAIGITLGTISAIHENRALDRVSLSLSTLGVTVPNFVLGPMLVLVFGIWLQQLPNSYDPRLPQPEVFYLIIPVVILAARPMATLTRLTRASTIDTLKQEFVKLAIAKGVPKSRLYVSHVFRNAVMPVVTAIGTSFGFLLTGSFITERFYVIPGIGFYTIEAIQKRDTPVILAMVLVTGAMFVFVNLLVDLFLPLLDPRIRESQV